MNERIKEAWQKAINDDDTWEGQIRFLDTFAQNIIRECVKVVDDTMTENQEMNIGLVMASAAIISHFGVEE